MKNGNETFIILALAQRAMELAVRISTETTANAWFDYSGHCNGVGARYSPKQWRTWIDEDEKTRDTAVYIESCSRATAKTLQRIVDCFEFIYAVAERKDA